MEAPVAMIAPVAESHRDNILSSDIILFINNYFTESKLTKTLKVKEITIYETIKLNRLDLSKLLVKIKKNFIKNISYKVFTAVI